MVSRMPTKPLSLRPTTGSPAMPSPVRHEAAREPSQVPRRGLRNARSQVQVSGCPLSELRRVWTTLPTACSKVATARQGKVVRAKAPANPKAKVEEEEKRDKSGGPVSSARRRSPPPPPVGLELARTRCSWITANSEPLYVVFHDEVWGVPVPDDRKLFEQLTLSQALAKLTWPDILDMREEFREMFDGFSYASVSEFTEERINLLLRSNVSMLLSEQKIPAVVTNAKQAQKTVGYRGLANR